MTRPNIIKSLLVALVALPALTVAAAAQGGPTPDFEGGLPPMERMMPKKERRNPAPCPLMGILYDAARQVEFRGGERYADIGFTGEINRVSGLCEYHGDKPIELQMDIEMAFGRGQKAMGEGKHIYRYWVAVTRTNIGPIAKQYFDVEVNFEKGQQVVRRTEKIKKIVIPRANATVAGPSFEVLVGFELTPEQLAFNRAGKRFRLDAIARGGG